MTIIHRDASESRLSGLFLGLFILLFASLFCSLIVLEWLVGCGEVTYFPDHTWVTNECLLLPIEMDSGMW
jgi:hypothetical protein